MEQLEIRFEPTFTASLWLSGAPERAVQTIKNSLRKFIFQILFKVSMISAQQICNKLDKTLGKIVDFLTPVVCITFKNDRFETNFIKKEKTLKTCNKNQKRKSALP